MPAFAFRYVAPVGEIGRLDDEGVAVPVTARVAHVETDVSSDVRPAVERNHARLVNELVADGDESRRLDDLDRSCPG